MVQWYSAVVQCNLVTVQWYSTVVQYSGTVNLVSVQWYSGSGTLVVIQC